MNMPLISIIVPVYNTEKYVCACVESLINQTYPNTEIILVDDGSTDACPAICDSYAGKYENVHVIHQKNQGLSAARNAALDCAKGEVIAFADSDDSVKPEMLSRLYALMEETGAPIASTGLDPALYGKRIDGVMDAETAIKNLLLDDVNFSISVWSKVFRAELFDGIRFPVGLMFEDFAIICPMFDRAGTVVHTGDVLYNYRDTNLDSLTRSRFSRRRMDYFTAADMVDDFLRGKYPSLLPYSQIRRTFYAIVSYKQLAQSGESLEDIRRELIRITRRGIWRYLFTRHAQLSVKAYGVMICLCPPIATKMFYKRPSKIKR